MDYRKLSFTLMTMSFVFIIAGAVSTFVMGLQEEKKAFYKKIDDTNNTFETFSTNTSIFEAMRDELYNVVLANVYYDTMYEEDKHIKNKLSNYEHLVDELTNNTNYLNKLCNYSNSSQEIKTKCNKYKSLYEQVMNCFVSDIEAYNENVLKYNEYQKSLGDIHLIKQYKTKKNYIDYNNNLVYDGKEE